MAPLRPRLTYANITATLALGLVLGGGTAYAAGLAPGSVGTKQLQKSAVTTPKLAKDAVKTKKVKDGTLKLADFAAAQRPLKDVVVRTGTIVFPASGGGTGVFMSGSAMCQPGEQAVSGGYTMDPNWSVGGQPNVIAIGSRPAVDASGTAPAAGAQASGWYVAAEQQSNSTSTTVTIWVLCGS